MTNTEAWRIIEKWAAENMPKNSAPNKTPGKPRPAPDLSRILRTAGATPNEFAAFMPHPPRK